MTAPIARIEPLQVLRGIAAILIMAKHALYEVDLISPIDFNYGNYKYYTVGIDIFFVLSGFIMVYISRGETGVAAAKEFMLRRLLRIVPTYWFYTFALLIVALVIPPVLDNAEFIPVDFLKSLFFIPYINSAGYMQPFLANGWSLNYEIYFYAIFALCLIFPPRIGIWVMCAYFIVTVLTDFFGLEGLLASFYSRIIILEFMVGALIGLAFKKNLRLPSYFFYIGLAFTAGSIITLFFTDLLLANGISYSKPFVGIMSVLLLVLPKKAEYIPMPKWAVYIGDSSYTLYLAHPFAIGAVTQAVLLLGWENSLNPWLVFAAVFLVCIFGSFLAYRIIEKPLLSFTKGLVYKKTNEKTS